MIQSITLENFKNHARTELRGLGQMTVLVGPNGAGKSSILGAISTALVWPDERTTASSPTRDHIRSQFLRRSNSDEDAVVFLGVQFTLLQSCWNNLAFWVFNPDSGPDRFFFEREPLPADDLSEEYREARRSAYRATRRIYTFSFAANHIASASVAESSSPSVMPDGSGTASVLASLQMSRPRVALAISDAVTRVVPNVKEVRTRRVSVKRTDSRTIRVDATAVPFADTREVIGEELVFDMRSGENIPASGASAGTLIVTALVTALLAQTGPRVLLLDDIETGLHPEAQREVITMLREMCAQDPELQILMTTHSPYVVDGFEAKDVWVVVADAEGLAHVRRLSDHPDAARAQQTLATGELWTAFGEDWALAPGPEKNAG